MLPINVNDRTPKNKQYVLVLLNNDNWCDSDDPEGDRYYKVVKFIKGLSKEDRKKLPDDNMSKFLFSGGDEDGNNLKPYCWDSFGASSYFGQDVDYWFELPQIDRMQGDQKC